MHHSSITAVQGAGTAVPGNGRAQPLHSPLPIFLFPWKNTNPICSSYLQVIFCSSSCLVLMYLHYCCCYACTATAVQGIGHRYVQRTAGAIAIGPQAIANIKTRSINTYWCHRTLLAQHSKTVKHFSRGPRALRSFKAARTAPIRSVIGS